MNLSDLKFESEILKIYDNNLNRKSKAALISLFQDIPSNKADVINRQEIINALINNFTDFRNISSLRLDIEESSIFTDSIIGSHGIFIAKKYREIRLRFLIDTKYRSQLFSNNSCSLLSSCQIVTSVISGLISINMILGKS